MKLIVTYIEPLQGRDRFIPLDIRSYILTIMKEDQEICTLLKEDDPNAPTFIFPMPNRKSFAIYTFKDDDNSKEMLKRIGDRIKSLDEIQINGVAVSVEKCFLAAFDFTTFNTGEYRKRLRTPMVIAVDNNDITQCINHTSPDPDLVWVADFAVLSIKKSLLKMINSWLSGFDIDYYTSVIEKAAISFEELEYRPIPNPDGKGYLPAIHGIVVSDVSLPSLVGYYVANGYGELARKNEKYI